MSSTASKAPNLDSLVTLQERLINQANVSTGNTIKGVVSDGTANVEFSIAHNLGKIPTGYVVSKQDKAGSIYSGATPNTATLLYLKGSVATITFDVIVY